MHRRPLFGFAFAVFVFTGVYFFLPNLQSEVITYAQLAAAGFLAIALHELGHVIGGKLMGMNFGYVVAGPFHIEKGKKGIRLRENRNWGLIGGVALMLPTPGHTEDRLRKDLSVMTISGPIMSSSLCVLFLAMWHFSTIEFFAFCSMLHGGILVATILPLPNGDFQTDGSAFYRLIRQTEAGERQIQSAKLMAEMYGAKRPVYWSSSLYEQCKKKVETAAELKDVFIESMFVFYVEADRDGIKPAIERLFHHFRIESDKRMAVYHGPFLEWRMLADAISGTLDDKTLHKYAEGVTMFSDGTYSRMQAMLAWSRQDLNKALAYSKEAFSPYAKLNGFGVLEREWTRMLATRIRTSVKTIA
ncbi:hypothetical protein SAMN05421663_109100 [Terribacillus halophilus]|uniref:Peptidase family M50 n=1 Tax=Terribacillus halophilus TaxID=361279 RepID=A0A1G6U0C4_9BACI|nr:M50 family metallopeptidase [Terribacillus halophilus]SDD33995.1 hypothetical protein SAMN05421663_109100 [Terribacillus halophilus]